MAAFYMVCDRLVERKPFLMMDSRSSQFFFDDDRDGCIDATGTLALPEIDPADFLPAVDGAEELCNEDLLGQGSSTTWSLPHNGRYTKLRGLTRRATTGSSDGSRIG